MRESTVVCLGEALALLPALPAADTAPDPTGGHLAGAEANVAAGLAVAGIPTARRVVGTDDPVALRRLLPHPGRWSSRTATAERWPSSGAGR